MEGTEETFLTVVNNNYEEQFAKNLVSLSPEEQGIALMAFSLGHKCASGRETLRLRAIRKCFTELRGNREKTNER